jgi:hypothetical protein
VFQCCLNYLGFTVADFSVFITGVQAQSPRNVLFWDLESKLLANQVIQAPGGDDAVVFDLPYFVSSTPPFRPWKTELNLNYSNPVPRLCRTWLTGELHGELYGI